ncbi:hypothetical protein [Nostoc flagelliforme]|uniref:hypothetical protein n=1 Tax=Nostoc flagelliforme TaxID=1306274 RepID=UPI0021F1A729|nr:hypothetical protein [Nostoc flagelliforme]
MNYYAENELWYEALQEALKVTSNGKLGETWAALVKELAQSEVLTGNNVDKKIFSNESNISRKLPTKEYSIAATRLWNAIYLTCIPLSRRPQCTHICVQNRSS